MGTTCDICDTKIEVSGDELTERRGIAFSNYSSKATAKIVTCPDCFGRMLKIQVGTDSVGQPYSVPKLTWKKWPERDSDKE